MDAIASTTDAPPVLDHYKRRLKELVQANNGISKKALKRLMIDDFKNVSRDEFETERAWSVANHGPDSPMSAFFAALPYRPESPLYNVRFWDEYFAGYNAEIHDEIARGNYATGIANVNASIDLLSKLFDDDPEPALLEAATELLRWYAKQRCGAFGEKDRFEFVNIFQAKSVIGSWVQLARKADTDITNDYLPQDSIGAGLSIDADDGALMTRYMYCHREVLKVPGAGPQWRAALSRSCWRWAKLGFQKIEMTDAFAASLIVSKAELADVRMPWKAFVIDIPLGLIFTEEGDSIDKMLVDCTDGDAIDCKVFAFASDGGKRWVTVVSLKQDEDPNDACSNVIRRLVASTCIACTVPGLLQKRPEPNGPRPSKPVKRDPKAPPAPPTFARYVLGKPINVDFRDRVRQFCRTGSFAGSKLEVRTMVRGHFKIVHHGPNWSLAKSKWIEPYWKGPEDGLTIVRPHVMKEPEKAATA